MEKEELIKRLLKLPNGEYYADIEQLMMPTEKKKNLAYSMFGDLLGISLSVLLNYVVCFDYYKYGLEYATNGKVRYIGTNDLNTIVINK